MEYERSIGPSLERIVDKLVAIRLVHSVSRDIAEPDVRELLLRELKDVADELAGEAPSPTERLLADSAALDWMTFRLFQRRGLAASDSPITEKWADRAHKRFLSTLRTLETVRRLARPIVRVEFKATQAGTSLGQEIHEAALPNRSAARALDST